jgi:hypothetical protein
MENELATLTQITATCLGRKNYHDIGFYEKRFLRRKWVKIAEIVIDLGLSNFEVSKSKNFPVRRFLKL